MTNRTTAVRSHLLYTHLPARHLKQPSPPNTKKTKKNVFFEQGVRQDVEAYVPNAKSFYVAFDAASNTTMGTGKVALQEFNARNPTVFFPRYDDR